MALVLKEGIIVNDTILNYDEFVNYIKPKLNNLDFLITLRNKVQSIIRSIEKKSIKEVAIQWEELQRKFLGNNTPVSLLVVTNIADEKGNYNIFSAKKEINVLTEKGYFIQGGKKFNDYYKEEQRLNLELSIKQHLLQFLNEVETKGINYDPEGLSIMFYFIKEAPNSLVKSHIGKMFHNLPNSYSNILYNSESNPNWRGNVTDAFINHLGHYHAQLLFKQQEDKEFPSVFSEEGFYVNKLLIDSTNKTPWQSGGDLFVIYQGMRINIQLKTTQRQKPQVAGSKATFEFLQFLKTIKTQLEPNNLNLNVIPEMYDFLKTSGWIEAVNPKIEEKKDEIIKSFSKESLNKLIIIS